jgi:hypothetical protein
VLYFTAPSAQSSGIQVVPGVGPREAALTLKGGF